MRHIDLFSGIGGMTRSLQHVSQPLLYCDSCPHAQQTLGTLMDDGSLATAPVVKDVKKLVVCPKGVDIITAGFPCTGFSVAGDKLGFANTQSSLFFEVVRVTAVVCPSFVLLENTPFVADDANLNVIRTEFKKLGYALRWCILPAFVVGIPQNRRRWFAIAYKKEESLGVLLKALMQTECACNGKEPPRMTLQKDPLACRRFALLRNSVVPQCAAYAWRYLADLRHTAVRPAIAKPDLKLLFTNGTITFRKCVWPTPHGGWSKGAEVMNERATRDICTAVVYEQHTPRGGFINIEWIEWLMGYPSGWTKLTSKMAPHSRTHGGSSGRHLVANSG